jgi:hypothetical protein
MAAQVVARISAAGKRLGGMCEINALCDSNDQPLASMEDPNNCRPF